MISVEPAGAGEHRLREPFRILLVCTGNVCRSPVAEQILRTWLDLLRPGCFRIGSAGTKALAGSPMTDLAEQQLAALAPPRSFTARQLTAGMLPAQHLLLAMSREHRAEIVRLAPGVLKRTFTLREFGRMVRHLQAAGDGRTFAPDAPGRWHQLVSRVPAVRPDTLAADEADDDVVDPYHSGAEVYEHMMDQMLPALRALRTFEESFGGPGPEPAWQRG